MEIEKSGAKMKAMIDRIEDGTTAVIIVENFGTLHVPIKFFKFTIHEGMHLNFKAEPDASSELKTIQAVKNLQSKLLKKSKD